MSRLIPQLASLRAAAMARSPPHFVQQGPRREELLGVGRGKAGAGEGRLVNWLVLMHSFGIHHFRKG